MYMLYTCGDMQIACTVCLLNLPMQLAGLSDLDGKRLMLTGMHGSGINAIKLPKLSGHMTDRAAEKQHLEVKVTPVQPGGLGCVGWFDLHGNRVAPLGCVHALVIQLHAGYAPNFNATLRGNA